MHSAVAHHMMPRPFLSNGRHPPANSCSLYTLSLTSYGISLWPVWVSCPGCVPAQLPVKINFIPAEPGTVINAFCNVDAYLGHTSGSKTN